jgi:hypothetical protein
MLPAQPGKALEAVGTGLYPVVFFAGGAAKDGK